MSKKKKNREKFQRLIDFDKYKKRFVALKMCYIGFDYHGFEYQGEEIPTIEREFFSVLRMMRLVEGEQSEWRYSKCGRTDKGVSAYGQVVTLLLRTCRLVGEDSPSEQHEIDAMDEKVFLHALNRKLPDNIKILAWAPCTETFNARFSCTSRTYNYRFPVGNLNIDLMNEAAKMFIGSHDFRNFCKMKRFKSPEPVCYIRRLDFCEVLHDPKESEFATIVMKGSSFLWHQVRMMTGLLLYIGMKKEKPSIVQELLNVTKHPSKPASAMTSPLPLVLVDSEFDEPLDWHAISESSSLLGLGRLRNEHLCKESIISNLFTLFSLKSLGEITFLLSDPSDGTGKGRFIPPRLVVAEKRKIGALI